MEAKKISLDVRDNTKFTRFFQIVFGIFCLAVAAWFFYNLLTTKSISGTNSIAVVFLFLFGIWELLAGAGLTARYIIISKEFITLKQKYFSKPLMLNPGDLKKVVFKPIAFELITQDSVKITIKLGLYYRERTEEILESVEKFCELNNVPVDGLVSDEK
jgi:hypothetical protein